MIESRIDAVEKIGKLFDEFSSKNTKENDEFGEEMLNIINLANAKNQWFNRENQVLAAENWANVLNRKNIVSWLEKYPKIKENQKTVGIVCAGNIPWVGLHDFLCAFLCGYNVKIKLSSKDEVLMKFILDQLIASNPEFQFNIKIEEKLKNIDFLIATGSNNTSRYFDYYYRHIPRIIRKNRTSVAIVEDSTTYQELRELSKDVFQFFGLGCRSVSHLFLPRNFDVSQFGKAFDDFSQLKNHNKYMNNYDYQKAINFVNNKKFKDFDFFLMEKNNSLSSPIGTLYYSFYDDLEEVRETLKSKNKEIQAIVCSVFTKEIENSSNFGKAQKPKIFDYADQMDTMKFLLEEN